MKEITEITNDYKQQLAPTLEDNSVFNLDLRYKKQEECWFYSITYGNLIIKNSKLVLSSNLLNQWKNILPFGLACLSSDEAAKTSDPFLLNDFSSGRVKLYILTKDELAQMEDALNNG